MRRILVLLLVLAPALATPGGAWGAQPPASGRVVGATVAVSGVSATAPAPPAAVAAQAAAPSHGAVAPTAHAAATSSVAIRDFSFGPAAITVHVGDTVTWSNAGPTPHTATANDGGFDTGTLRAGQSGSHTFTSAGTFAYHCTLHPFMRGTVTVLAAATSGGGGGNAAPAAPAAPPAPAGAAAAPAPAPHGPTLPNTGMSALGLAGLGALMLLSGVILRALTRPA